MKRSVMQSIGNNIRTETASIWSASTRSAPLCYSTYAESLEHLIYARRVTHSHLSRARTQSTLNLSSLSSRSEGDEINSSQLTLLILHILLSTPGMLSILKLNSRSPPPGRLERRGDRREVREDGGPKRIERTNQLECNLSFCLHTSERCTITCTHFNRKRPSAKILALRSNA
jgi:hypothetical protein